MLERFFTCTSWDRAQRVDGLQRWDVGGGCQSRCLETDSSLPPWHACEMKQTIHAEQIRHPKAWTLHNSTKEPQCMLCTRDDTGACMCTPKNPTKRFSKSALWVHDRKVLPHTTSSLSNNSNLMIYDAWLIILTFHTGFDDVWRLNYTIRGASPNYIRRSRFNCGGWRQV